MLMIARLTAACLLLASSSISSLCQPPPSEAGEVERVKSVAVLPWSLQGGTETAVETAKKTVTALFEGAKYEVIPDPRVRTAWEDDLRMPAAKGVVKDKEALPNLPEPRDLLELGKRLGVDIVCAGRASWHTRSIWVGLGPKTKADCTVDVIIIDVAKGEVILSAEGVKADSTKREKGIETAAALLVSAGFTALSGGPKTPHQQRSAQNAISLALEPWLKTTAPSSRKIKS
jgi:hypothetical protein